MASSSASHSTRGAGHGDFAQCDRKSRHGNAVAVGVPSGRSTGRAPTRRSIRDGRPSRRVAPVVGRAGNGAGEPTVAGLDRRRFLRACTPSGRSAARSASPPASSIRVEGRHASRASAPLTSWPQPLRSRCTSAAASRRAAPCTPELVASEVGQLSSVPIARKARPEARLHHRRQASRFSARSPILAEAGRRRRGTGAG